MRKLAFQVALVLSLSAPTVHAHFNMLLPASAYGKKGEAATFTYQWGHPYEHQLFDAPQPVSVIIRGPDGKTRDVSKTLEKITVPAAEGKTVAAFRFGFTPEERGDYVIVLKAAPIYLEEDGEFVQDLVKAVFHVQAQKGWDAVSQEEWEWSPVTRPYGLEPGMVFQAQMTAVLPLERPKQVDPPLSTELTVVQPRDPVRYLLPFKGAMVEVERYNAVAPKTLPADEHITRVVKTDATGVATCTLTDPGWWCLTTTRDGGTLKHDGKDKPVRQRSTLWVFVDEKQGR